MIAAIDGAPLTEGENTRSLMALSLAHFSQPGLILEGNLQALVQGDLVNTIRDTSLRGRILAAQSIATMNVAGLQSINDMIIRVPRFDEFLTREKRAESGDLYTVRAFDAAGMAQSYGVRDAVINLANYHRISARSVSFQMDSVVDVLERLEELGAYSPPEEAPGCLYGPPSTRDLE